MISVLVVAIKNSRNGENLDIKTTSSSSLVHAVKIHSNGAVEFLEAPYVKAPLQPAFSCILGAGNQGSLAVSTTHTVLFTEVYDQNADFASNTFTAPVTGKYQLQSNLYINSMDDATAFFQLLLVTSNRTYYAIIDPRAFDSDPGQCSLQIAVLADMDANDTAVVKLQLGSGGSAQSSIYSDSNFSGFLAC